MITLTWHRLTCPCGQRTYLLLDPAETLVGCEACGRWLERARVKVVSVEAEKGRELDEADRV